MDYIESLNEPQREAVLHKDGPMMIVAGAGSGKTRVLTYKIAFLIDQGIEPFNILALTFTNKAAREMRERIEKQVGSEARNLWMGTFHSVFAKILRIEAERIGYTSNFTIYDSDDSKTLVKQIVKDMGLDEKMYKHNTVLSRISNAKNYLVSWRKYLNDPIAIATDQENGRPKLAEIYKEYCLRCYKANAMDFDDLLFNTNVLLSQHLDVLNKYQQKFQYVMIDEFQDTNISQYQIVKRLSAVRENITVVGDDAQSIYAFRGANIQNILNFEKDYPSLKVVKLEQNYRSSENIVNAANSIISHNKNQLQKRVWTSNGAGSKIKVIKALSDQEEARLIATYIFQEKANEGLSHADFAILYRTNAQSRALEEALRRNNIPYKIIGGLSFYKRKEVKDLVAYLNFAINPNSEVDFRRIVNYPKRSIGKTTVDKVVVKAGETGQPLWEVVANPVKYFGGGRIAKAMDSFATLIKLIQQQKDKKNAYDFANYVASQSGLLKELYDDKSLEGRTRYENVQELLNAVKAFVDDPEVEDKSIEAFLQNVALVSSADQTVDGDAVTMMTIHMSKGLEYEQVYIAGLEENLFPSQLMLESREDLEEERRLFYVAVTRAKTKLTLTYALQRYKFGKIDYSDPSRFLQEIDEQYLDILTPASSGPSMDSNFPDLGGGSNLIAPKRKTRPQPTSTSSHKASPGFKPSPASTIEAGQKVEHQKFGYGQVLEIEKTSGVVWAKVNFDQAGEKKLHLGFAKLMVVE